MNIKKRAFFAQIENATSRCSSLHFHTNAKVTFFSSVNPFAHTNFIVALLSSLIVLLYATFLFFLITRNNRFYVFCFGAITLYYTRICTFISHPKHLKVCVISQGTQESRRYLRIPTNLVRFIYRYYNRQESQRLLWISIHPKERLLLPFLLR